tara:strand:+ start:256 stop:462 length:207 start_codon:yes stop_codon:yes gene_type:complete
MTYIWNRANRVEINVMPEVVQESFAKWENDLKRDWQYLSEDRKKLITLRIVREKNNMNYSLTQLGYNK